MWFKGLVSIACLAVIAVAGIYVWDRFSAEAAPLNERRMDCWHYANAGEVGTDDKMIADLIKRDCPSPADFDATAAEINQVCSEYRSKPELYLEPGKPEEYQQLLAGCP